MWARTKDARRVEFFQAGFVRVKDLAPELLRAWCGDVRADEREFAGHCAQGDRGLGGGAACWSGYNKVIKISVGW